MSTKQQITPYPIRMEPELRSALEKAAQQSNRSLHAEIISRLELTLDPSRGSLGLLGAPTQGPLNSPDKQSSKFEIEEIATKVAEKAAKETAEKQKLQLMQNLHTLERLLSKSSEKKDFPWPLFFEALLASYDQEQPNPRDIDKK